MAHRRHRDRNRNRFDTDTLQDTQTITVSDNRALKHALAVASEQRRLGYPVSRIQIRVSDIPDDTRRKDTRNLASRNYRSPSPLERQLRPHADERLTSLEKIQHFNARDWSYDLPKDHPICQKRKERKEVMFAKRKAGKGGQSPLKLPRINIRCK